MDRQTDRQEEVTALLYSDAVPQKEGSRHVIAHSTSGIRTASLSTTPNKVRITDVPAFDLVSTTT